MHKMNRVVRGFVACRLLAHSVVGGSLLHFVLVAIVLLCSLRVRACVRACVVRACVRACVRTCCCVHVCCLGAGLHRSYLNTTHSQFEIQVASKWHDVWRSSGDGSVQPVFTYSAVTDQRHNIAALSFDQLPADLQALTFVTTKLVCTEIELQFELNSHAKNPFDIPPLKGEGKQGKLYQFDKVHT